jgi:hypothetical protein
MQSNNEKKFIRFYCGISVIIKARSDYSSYTKVKLKQLFALSVSLLTTQGNFRRESAERRCFNFQHNSSNLGNVA